MIDIILITFCAIITALLCGLRVMWLADKECRRTILLSRTIGFIAKDKNFNLRK